MGVLDWLLKRNSTEEAAPGLSQPARKANPAFPLRLTAIAHEGKQGVYEWLLWFPSAADFPPAVSAADVVRWMAAGRPVHFIDVRRQGVIGRLPIPGAIQHPIASWAAEDEKRSLIARLAQLPGFEALVLIDEQPARNNARSLLGQLPPELRHLPPGSVSRAVVVHKEHQKDNEGIDYYATYAWLDPSGQLRSETAHHGWEGYFGESSYIAHLREGDVLHVVRSDGIEYLHEKEFITRTDKTPFRGKW